MRHVWSVLCERVLHDVDTRQITLVDVAEEIGVEGTIPPKDAAAPVNLALVTYWVRSNPNEPEEGKMRIDVRWPDGEEQNGLETAVDLKTDGRIQTVGRIPVLPLRGPGRYELVVRRKERSQSQWETCVALPLDMAETTDD